MNKNPPKQRDTSQRTNIWYMLGNKIVFEIDHFEGNSLMLHIIGKLLNRNILHGYLISATRIQSPSKFNNETLSKTTLK